MISWGEWGTVGMGGNQIYGFSEFRYYSNSSRGAIYIIKSGPRESSSNLWVTILIGSQ
jgi:hypothetical protein